MSAVSVPTTPTAAPAVGPRVRALRETAGLSLRDLAARSGVSAQMLSQVERGETSPTLAVAGKIAAGLGLTLSALLRLDESRSVVVQRAAERSTVRRKGHQLTDLTPPLPGRRVAVTAHRLKGRSRTGAEGDPPLHAPGSREVCIVEEGSLRLIVDGEAFALEAGDSVSFDADLPHHFENPGTGEARFLAVVTAGLRHV